MRATALVVITPLLSGCTATLLFEPRLLVSPYLAEYQLRGKVAATSNPGPGAPAPQNVPQSLRTFGQDHYKDDVGVRADFGDGFAGLRVDYYRLDMGTTRLGVLEADWGRLLTNDLVRMHAEMDEVRIGYLEPLFETKWDVREHPLEVQFAGGAVLAHRDLHLRASTQDGSRRQNLEIDGDVVYAAARARASWQNFAFDAEYAISPSASLGGDFDGTQQDLELRASYTLPLRDVTFFGGYRYSRLEADGRTDGADYDANLEIDGFQLGIVFTF